MNHDLSPEALAALAQRKLLRQSTRPASLQKRAATSGLSARQRCGLAYEKRAATYLQQQGLHILQHNLRSPFGEIDIVARSEACLVFIEVRYRQRSNYGGAIYSVQRPKQQRLIKTAHYHLSALCQLYFNGVMPFYRFDVIAFDEHTYQWIQNAFS